MHSEFSFCQKTVIIKKSKKALVFVISNPLSDGCVCVGALFRCFCNILFV